MTKVSINVISILLNVRNISPPIEHVKDFIRGTLLNNQWGESHRFVEFQSILTRFNEVLNLNNTSEITFQDDSPSSSFHICLVDSKKHCEGLRGDDFFFFHLQKKKRLSFKGSITY